MIRGILTRMIGGIWLAAAAALAAAQESPMPVRSFDRFEFDTQTARGLWLEVATGFSRTELDVQTVESQTVEATTVEPRLVYGGEEFELGLFIPYRSLAVETRFRSGPVVQVIPSVPNGNGIGDIRLYGKAVPVRTTWFDAGLGLELSFPSGDEQEGLGAGEVGLLPYGMAALHLGPADVRGHFGYLAFTDSRTDEDGNTFPPNAFVYGGGLFAPLNDFLGARAEFVGETLDERPSGTAVAFEPGVDVRLPLGSVDLFLRPTGAIGLTDDAADWGVGGSVTLAWNPR